VARAPRLYRHKRVRKCAHVLGLQLCYGRGFIGARRPRDFCATLTRRRPRARARRKRAFQIGEIKRDGATCRNRLAHASPSPFIALMKRDRSRPGRAPVAPRSRPGHTRLCATRRETMKSSQTSRGCIMRGLRDEQSRLYCPRGLEFSFFLSFFLSFSVVAPYLHTIWTREGAVRWAYFRNSHFVPSRPSSSPFFEP
jgi:hypothetical protein